MGMSAALAMRTIGLLGGMSWESSIEYERIINEEVRQRRGGLHSAPLVVICHDFADIERLQRGGHWQEAGELLSDSALRLERAGAEVIALCTNTMHSVADAIECAIAVEFVHIADATGTAITNDDITTIGLLGTKYTMEERFYRDRLEQRHGLTVITPAAEDRDLVHHVIYEELVRGIVNPRSRAAYLSVIARMQSAGVQGVIAGCTEIELLVTAGDVGELAYFPSTRLHALAIVDAALAI